MNFLSVLTLGVGGWLFVSGILHDIGILRSDHALQYDRNLLRLLMDGHILITCGAFQMIAFLGLRNNEPWAYYISGLAYISILVYCGMIFPFLKSMFTIILNSVLLIALLINYWKLP